MTLIDLLAVLFVAGIIGSIGQALAGVSMGGCLVSIVVGFVGALVGVWLARSLELPELLAITVGGKTFPVIWSVIGSAVFVFVVSLFSRRRVV
jgi:uncharacterized membrane protein YeaQ/YmgE (transglycosylase-associated protein family)